MNFPAHLRSVSTTALRSSLLSFSVLCISVAASAQAPADNSGANKSQRHTPTADQQKNGPSDVKLAAAIRRSVIADKSLSTYGHNIKIIVAHGAVTLKGPVHSEDEKQNIVSKASDVVGKDHVTDQITVK